MSNPGRSSETFKNSDLRKRYIKKTPLFHKNTFFDLIFISVESLNLEREHFGAIILRIKMRMSCKKLKSSSVFLVIYLDLFHKAQI